MNNTSSRFLLFFFTAMFLLHGAADLQAQVEPLTFEGGNDLITILFNVPANTNITIDNLSTDTALRQFNDDAGRQLTIGALTGILTGVRQVFLGDTLLPDSIGTDQFVDLPGSSVPDPSPVFIGFSANSNDVGYFEVSFEGQDIIYSKGKLGVGGTSVTVGVPEPAGCGALALLVIVASVRKRRR